MRFAYDKIKKEFKKLVHNLSVVKMKTPGKYRISFEVSEKDLKESGLFDIFVELATM